LKKKKIERKQNLLLKEIIKEYKIFYKKVTYFDPLYIISTTLCKSKIIINKIIFCICKGEKMRDNK